MVFSLFSPNFQPYDAETFFYPAISIVMMLITEATTTITRTMALKSVFMERKRKRKAKTKTKKK